jgi:hypothetical protein
MTIPTAVKTWTISPNNRISYVSLLDTTQRYLHGIKTFLLAHGWTTKGSAKSGTGAMDNTDRWTLTTDVTPRGATQAVSCGWWVGQDANGAQLCLAACGPTDDCGRISFSPSGGFTITPNSGVLAAVSVSSGSKTWTRTTTGGDAGTGSWILDGFVVGGTITFAGFANAGNNGTFTITTLTATVVTCSAAAGLVTESNASGTSATTSADGSHVPACKDAMLIWDTTSTLVNATTSGDRVWHGWVDSTSKLCRFAIGRAGSCIMAFGMELVTNGVGSTATFSPAVWGFAYNPAGSTEINVVSSYQINSNGGFAKVLVGGAQYACTIGSGISESGSSPFLGATVNQLNDDAHPIVEIPYGLISNKASATGRLGQRIDWWLGYLSAADADTYAGKTLVHVMAQIVWPWDGSTTPTYT